MQTALRTSYYYTSADSLSLRIVCNKDNLFCFVFLAVFQFIFGSHSVARDNIFWSYRHLIGNCFRKFFKILIVNRKSQDIEVFTSFINISTVWSNQKTTKIHEFLVSKGKSSNSCTFSQFVFKQFSHYQTLGIFPNGDQIRILNISIIF